MAEENKYEKIFSEISNLYKFIENLMSYEQMMDELVEYHNKHFTPPYKFYTVMAKYVIGDVIRCCEAMLHDSTDRQSYESEYVKYIAYHFYDKDADYVNLCGDKGFLDFIDTMKDGVFVTSGDKDRFNLLGFFAEEGYYNAASKYLTHLCVISIGMAVIDDHLTDAERSWLEYMKSKIDFYNEKLDNDDNPKEILIDPITWLNNCEDNDKDNHDVFKFQLDAVPENVYKLKKLLSLVIKGNKQPVFDIRKAGNTYLYKMSHDDESLFILSDGIDYERRFFDGYINCFATLVYIDRSSDPWKLYLKKWYDEDHITAKDYSPYILGRAYKGEIAVNTLSPTSARIELTHAILFESKYIAKFEGRRLFLYETTNNKKFEVKNLSENPFHNFLFAAVRNSQHVTATILTVRGSELIFKVNVESK